MLRLELLEIGKQFMVSTARIKSRDPRIEPWGTPDITLTVSEENLSRTTLCFLGEVAHKPEVENTTHSNTQ